MARVTLEWHGDDDPDAELTVTVPLTPVQRHLLESCLAIMEEES